MLISTLWLKKIFFFALLILFFACTIPVYASCGNGDWIDDCCGPGCTHCTYCSGDDDDDPPPPSCSWGPTINPGICSEGSGLWGQYYEGRAFNHLKMERRDSVIDFNWGNSSPDTTKLGCDNFSVGWTGYIKAVGGSQTYTIWAGSDDGIRVWIDKNRDGDFGNYQGSDAEQQEYIQEIVVDARYDRSFSWSSGTVSMIGNQWYKIQVAYYEHGGDARVQLDWEWPGHAREVIPSSVLNACSFPNNLPAPLSVYPVGQWSGIAWQGAVYNSAVDLNISPNNPPLSFQTIYQDLDGKANLTGQLGAGAVYLGFGPQAESAEGTNFIGAKYNVATNQFCTLGTTPTCATPNASLPLTSTLVLNNPAGSPVAELILRDSRRDFLAEESLPANQIQVGWKIKFLAASYNYNLWLKAEDGITGPLPVWSNNPSWVWNTDLGSPTFLFDSSTTADGQIFLPVTIYDNLSGVQPGTVGAQVLINGDWVEASVEEGDCTDDTRKNCRATITISGTATKIKVSAKDRAGSTGGGNLGTSFDLQIRAWMKVVGGDVQSNAK